MHAEVSQDLVHVLHGESSHGNFGRHIPRTWNMWPCGTTASHFKRVGIMQQTLDIHFRKFCRSIVGPPPYIDWTLAWHEILHTWNERAAHFVRVAKIESWSRMCVVHIGNWHLMLFNAPLTTGYEEFCIGNPWGKKTRTPKTVLGGQIGDVLSLPRIGSLGGGSTKL